MAGMRLKRPGSVKLCSTLWVLLQSQRQGRRGACQCNPPMLLSLHNRWCRGTAGLHVVAGWTWVCLVHGAGQGACCWCCKEQATLTASSTRPLHKLYSPLAGIQPNPRPERAVRSSIMGLCCHVIHHLSEAKSRLQHAYSCDCDQGSMEALSHW